MNETLRWGIALLVLAGLGLLIGGVAQDIGQAFGFFGALMVVAGLVAPKARGTTDASSHASE